MADFERELEVKYPQRNNFDSDKISYYVSEKTQRSSWFNVQDESTDTSGDDWE